MGIYSSDIVGALTLFTCLLHIVIVSRIVVGISFNRQFRVSLFLDTIMHARRLPSHPLRYFQSFYFLHRL